MRIIIFSNANLNQSKNLIQCSLQFFCMLAAVIVLGLGPLFLLFALLFSRRLAIKPFM